MSESKPPPRKREAKLPPNLTRERDRGSWRYRYKDPVTLQRKYMGRDRVKAIERAKAANKILAIRQAEDRYENNAVPTVRYVVQMYITDVVHFKAWSGGTRKNNMAKLELYIREFGNRAIEEINTPVLTDWINERSTTAETRNKHRSLLADIWDFAESRELIHRNKAALVRKADMSKKIPTNKKVRKRLQIDEFWTIHDHSETPGWLQRAMRFSLLTFQGRYEVCNVEYPRDGFFYVIRQKTHEDSELAFMKFRPDADLEALVIESRQDNIACPYVIHRRPDSMRPAHLNNKKHWAAIEPDYLSKAFKKARDLAGVGADLTTRQRPTFHEIRSLAGRRMEQSGWSQEDIQSSYAHGDKKVTELYLHDPENVKPAHFREVKIASGILGSRGA